MNGYRLARRAVTDLHDIVSHVAADDPIVGEQLLQVLEAAFERLADYPQLGRVQSDVSSRPVRFWTTHGFIVIYEVISDIVHITRIVRGRRDIGALLR